MTPPTQPAPVSELVDAMLEVTAPITQALDHMMRSPGEPDIHEAVAVLKGLLRDVLAPMGVMLSARDLRAATAVIEASVPMICERLVLVPHPPPPARARPRPRARSRCEAR